MKPELISKLVPGPVAIIINEDNEDVRATIDHAKSLGFSNVLLGTAGQTSVEGAIAIPYDPNSGTAAFLNPLIAALPGRWIYWSYNAEYLFFPFCETRSIQDAVQFVAEERRDAVFSVVVDLYPEDLASAPGGVDRAHAMFDAIGYFSRDRHEGPTRLERQIHVHGGLKRRFSEHVPWPRQPIERIALFRASPGLTMDDAGRLNEPERNTVSAAWHNSLTIAIASFRASKSLMTNPNSAEAISSLAWSGSRPFEWSSAQLMDHGLMEPGQWF